MINPEEARWLYTVTLQRDGDRRLLTVAPTTVIITLPTLESPESGPLTLAELWSLSVVGNNQGHCYCAIEVR